MKPQPSSEMGSGKTASKNGVELQTEKDLEDFKNLVYLR